MNQIKKNLETIQNNIEKILTRTGRENRVSLVAATKTVPVEKIEQAIQCGVKIIGENRVQEAAPKIERINADASWHMIGHLQRNKVKKALPIFQMIQSIDKTETAQEIEKRTSAPMDILIEINSSGEESKWGVMPEKLFYLVDELLKLQKVRIKGLMTIGPFTQDHSRIRQAFALVREKYEKLKENYQDLDISILSMGMSMDYQLAIEEGSNMVRLGSAIFGQRNYG